MRLRKDFVEELQRTMKIGAGVSWIDVEAMRPLATNPVPVMQIRLRLCGGNNGWVSSNAVVQKAILHLLNPPLNPPKTVQRAPGPGEVRKTEWVPLANKYLRSRPVIVHTDSARSYKIRVVGVVHDNGRSRQEACQGWRQIDMEGPNICQGDNL